MTILVRASNFAGLLPKAKMIDRDAQNLAATSAWLQAQPKLLLVRDGAVPRLSSLKFEGLLLEFLNATIFSCASDMVAIGCC
jgi:hypothetical protein